MVACAVKVSPPPFSVDHSPLFDCQTNRNHARFKVYTNPGGHAPPLCTKRRGFIRALSGFEQCVKRSLSQQEPATWMFMLKPHESQLSCTRPDLGPPTANRSRWDKVGSSFRNRCLPRSAWMEKHRPKSARFRNWTSVFEGRSWPRSHAFSSQPPTALSPKLFNG